MPECGAQLVYTDANKIKCHIEAAGEGDPRYNLSTRWRTTLLP
jgi:hypothetical protein